MREAAKKIKVFYRRRYSHFKTLFVVNERIASKKIKEE